MGSHIRCVENLVDSQVALHIPNEAWERTLLVILIVRDQLFELKLPLFRRCSPKATAGDSRLCGNAGGFKRNLVSKKINEGF